MLSHAIKVKQNLHSKNAFSWRYTLFLLITIRFKTILINISVLKNILSEPPPVRSMTYQFEIERNQPTKYEGPWPQTAQSVTEFFDGLETHSTYDEIDEKLSRVEWVAMLLEKGFTIDDYGEYSHFLSDRYRLLRSENDPEAWASGKYGVAPAQDWETYIDNFIDRHISVVKEISAANKTDVITGWTFIGPNESVLLPFNGNRVYVDLDDNGSGSFLGAELTDRERYNTDISHNCSAHVKNKCK